MIEGFILFYFCCVLAVLLTAFAPKLRKQIYRVMLYKLTQDLIHGKISYIDYKRKRIALFTKLKTLN
jgi:hypothetical protein